MFFVIQGQAFRMWFVGFLLGFRFHDKGLDFSQGGPIMFYQNLLLITKIFTDELSSQNYYSILEYIWILPPKNGESNGKENGK